MDANETVAAVSYWLLPYLRVVAVLTRGLRSVLDV
jgi:hypothetical protein